ncbi:transmembrane protein 88B [Silurus meridionalis]|uniref:Transmembrane protein 88B n=1 Tax=Silurus meridionalis TaxID=175797 RepID=A0A8T0AP22_SILME
MCGVDMDLEDDGVQDECEVEEVSQDAVRLLAPPLAECNGEAWGSRRGRGVCVLCGLMLALWNVGVGVACVMLLCVVFMLVLTPPTLLLYTGFLCHTRVLASPSTLCRYLDDNSCSALIILGFVMMSPLVVVAAVTYCSLLRRFHLLQIFQPLSVARHRGRGFVWKRDVQAWV